MLRQIAPSALFLALAAPASAAPERLDPRFFEQLRVADARLATAAHRLVTANVALCAERQPAPGLVLHAIDQYPPTERDAARAAFGFDRPVAVELVVSDGPADRAGVRPNDSVRAVNGRAVPSVGSDVPATSATRDAALALLADQPADAPVTLALVRAGVTREAEVPASPGCRAAFEVLLGPGMVAKSDGRIVQIGARVLEKFDDVALAVVVAHELAHLILRHRARLETAGVRWGLLSEFGRNRRLFRRTEDDADLLSVALLYNAGFDPASAPAFWRAHGDEVSGGFGGVFRARTHGSPGVRARALDAAVATIPMGAARPYVPAVLATRDQPLR